MEIEAWHFLRADKRFGYGDDKVAVAGYVYSVEPPIKLCNWGLHASIRAIDALQYAPGPVVGRVVLSGDIIQGDDKCVATHREYLWLADATNVLWEFTCWAAEEAIKAQRGEGYNVPQACYDAIATRRLWLRGKATDKDLSAAMSAAEAATRGAAEATRSAAMSAARWTAESAARWAAESAARSTAMSVTRWAARSAAMSAVRSAQNTELERRLLELGGEK